MKTWLLLAIMTLAACSTPRPGPDPGIASALAESNFVTGSPRLGVGFGRLVTIEAESTVDEASKGTKEPALRVLFINGQAAPEDLLVPWTYGGWFAEHPVASGRDGFHVEAGQTYLLRGYETGGWVGMPQDVYPVLVDEWGPPQGKGYHFRSVFRVIDGKVQARASGSIKDDR